MSEKPLAHVHWRVYKEDLERLRAMFGHDHGGMQRAIRAMVHSFMNHNYATLHQKIDEIEARFGAPQIQGEPNNESTELTTDAPHTAGVNESPYS